MTRRRRRDKTTTPRPNGQSAASTSSAAASRPARGCTPCWSPNGRARRRLLNEVRRLVGPLPGTVGIKPEQPTPTSPSPSSNNQQQQQQQQTQQPPLSFLHNKGDLTASDASTPLTTTTAFSLSQLQALRDLSTTLRSFMPRLQNITTTASDDDDEDDEYDSESGKKTKSWRRQRLEYVESATRRYLENVRAGGGDDDGAEGEWLATTGGKRAVARVEVEGLETVVGLLGASVGGNNGKDNNQSNRNNGGGAHGTGAEEGDRMDES
ncbi:hypothetical protein VTJ04DRAFT_418 [Mycothermus thermophilus]|uniref:uncharacterized protein n=1 Tax=Humicola insolens TaxID=85995 RepID=UPI00374211FE